MEAMIILLLVVVGAVGGVIAILSNEKKKRAAKGGAAVRKDNGNQQMWMRIHRFLWGNFITRTNYQKLYENVSEIGVYGITELRATASKFFIQTNGIAAAITIIGMICFQDLIASIILIGFGVLMQNVLVNKSVDKVHFALIKELSTALASVREEYTKHGTIPDAINECKKGKLVQPSFEKIYIILTSVDGRDRLDEFYATTPVRLLQTFANVCYVLNDSGDQVATDGSSAFKQGITFLKNEVDMEIRKLTKTKLAFGFLEWLPVVPMFITGIVKDFFMSNIPGTSVVYNGMIGYIARLVLALSAVLGYYVISVINSPNSIKSNDRSPWIDALLHKHWFNKYINCIIPKKTRGKVKFEKLTKNSLTTKDLRYYYASKTLVAGIAAILTTVVLTLVMQFAREFVYKNTQSLSMVAGTQYTVSQQEAIEAMDKDWMKMCEEIYPEDPVIETATALVYERLPDIYEMDKLEHAARLMTKWQTYAGLTWHWWFVLIIFGVGFAAWFSPALMIVFRKYLVKTESEEDVLQMQTMLSILMYTSLDTLDAIYWLIQTSKIHKDILIYCYHEYPSNPEVAIERMKSKVGLAEFQNICDKLISTISSVSLKDAFADLILERQHVMRLREMTQESTIEKKRMLASPLAMAPLFVLVVGYVLLPVGVLGVQEFISAFEDMGMM